MKQLNILILCCLALNISLISKDIYIPSLPIMAHELNIPAANVGASITFFLIGMAFSQLIFGALSDIYGRKVILLCGIGMCLIGNLLNIFTHSGFELIFWRFFAGCGAGACPVIARAIVNDIYKENTLTKAISYLSMSTVVSPLLAPLVGGLLQDAIGWRADFIFLSILTILAFLLFYFLLPETHINIRKSSPTTFETIMPNSLTIIKDPLFLLYSSLSVLAFAPSLIYILMSPFIFQQQLGLTPTQNGAQYIYLAVGYLVGASLVNRLAGKIPDDMILFCGLIISLIGGTSMLIWTQLTHVTTLSLSLPMVVNTIGSGLITPIANKHGIALFPASLGMSAALLGFFRMLGVFLLASTLPLLLTNDQFSLAITLIVLSLASTGIFIAKRTYHKESYMAL